MFFTWTTPCVRKPKRAAPRLRSKLTTRTGLPSSRPTATPSSSVDGQAPRAAPRGRRGRRHDARPPALDDAHHDLAAAVERARRTCRSPWSRQSKSSHASSRAGSSAAGIAICRLDPACARGRRRRGSAPCPARPSMRSDVPSTTSRPSARVERLAVVEGEPRRDLATPPADAGPGAASTSTGSPPSTRMRSAAAGAHRADDDACTRRGGRAERDRRPAARARPASATRPPPSPPSIGAAAASPAIFSPRPRRRAPSRRPSAAPPRAAAPRAPAGPFDAVDELGPRPVVRVALREEVAAAVLDAPVALGERLQEELRLLGLARHEQLHHGLEVLPVVGEREARPADVRHERELALARARVAARADAEQHRLDVREEVAEVGLAGAPPPRAPRPAPRPSRR